MVIRKNKQIDSLDMTNYVCLIDLISPQWITLQNCQYNIMDRWPSRRLSEDFLQLNTMKSFNNTFMRYPRQSQPQVHEGQVFTELESVRRKHQSFKDDHKCKQAELTGSSWNSKHLDLFLKEKGSTGSLSQRHKKDKSKATKEKTAEHFFRTTMDNKNTSHIGFTNVNPLATYSKVQPHKLDRFCSEILNRDRLTSAPQAPQTDRFRFQSNSVKYKVTNPLTFRNVELPQEEHIQSKKVRLLNLIEKRYPHGMVGLDNPDQAVRFYKRIEPKSLKGRQLSEPRETFQFDKEWKTKRRVQQIQPEVKREIVCIRRLKNTSGLDYNIISNTQM